jgi:NTE family protein
MAFGLVLGAGGQVGEAFHRGVVRAMTDRGLDPRAAEVVVGTSAGAVVAASLRRYGRPAGRAGR